ncbi:uncharacterized protein LOC116207206 isoform X2 [Punica granatum]|uniref:Phosphoglycerate kinase n=1 Tax=Punica granatum TaxID=22663 RepID=A0A6P8DUT8_PUNGR|nr:uncharacterized protein LOC116207206 isoform X2 [Punica granatum]
MTQLLLNSVHGTPLFCSFHRPVKITKFLPRIPCHHFGHRTAFPKECFTGVRSSLQGSFVAGDDAVNSAVNKALASDGDESLDALPHVQTLRTFPKEELHGKVVMVRFDSTVLLQEDHDWRSISFSNALFTIKYLLEARARVILVSDWKEKTDSRFHALESTAEYLSSILNCKIVPTRCIPFNMEGLEQMDALLCENLSKFRGEVSNSSELAELLSSGVDIFVNDSFSQSHKILASTVAITRFCYASLAGFHFEDSLYNLRNASETSKQHYIAIIMHALGLPVPLNLVEQGARKEALDLIQVAKDRGIPILCPEDFWCMNSQLLGQLKIFPAHGILEGWIPVDLGPRSLDEINTLLTKCKKLLWIGPVKFKLFSPSTNGMSEMASMINEQCAVDCDITVVGRTACKAMMRGSSSIASLHLIENACVLWEFLKGRKLPGVPALDRAYPFVIDWTSVYCKPAQPLFVDVGSGNGLFLLEMGKRRKDLNFLGLEINEKLVKRCLLSLHQSRLENRYFMATNATSTFRSIVCTYPGEVVLVSIQCPNPDFNKPEHRWRMVQRSLVEAIADLLASNGKVFLQSDVEAVAVRMKEQFLRYGRGKLVLVSNLDDIEINGRYWLRENPFGVRSDWEQHVLDRGAPMYRLMLTKSSSGE